MGSAPVGLTARWNVPPGQTNAIASALQTLMLATRHEHGCVACLLETEVGERITLRYEELWQTEEDLQRRIQSERFAQIAGLVEYATEQPCIEFTLASGTRGLDYADEILRAKERST
jgi:quinol monooxygenase YgiN